MHPRNQGSFFWSQAYRLKQLGFNSMYIAMYDEYDEGTGIMKNASDYFDIPTDQWFVTASVDGYWLSSDFQMRTAGAAIRMLKGENPLTATNPVPHSEGPIYYRNSFESRFVNTKDQQYSGIYPVDPLFKNPAEIDASGVSGQNTEIVQTNLAKTGQYAARISGNSLTLVSSYYYKIADVNIAVKKGMELHFSKLAANEQGRNTNIGIILDDETCFMNQTPVNGNLNQWVDVSYVVGTETLSGKTIVGIVLAYEISSAGAFDAYFDDIMIIDGNTTNNGDTQIAQNKAKQHLNFAAIVNGRINLSLSGGGNCANIALYDVRGRLLFEQNIAMNGNFASVALPKSIVGNQTAILQVKTNGLNLTKKVLIK